MCARMHACIICLSACPFLHLSIVVRIQTGAGRIPNRISWKFAAITRKKIKSIGNQIRRGKSEDTRGAKAPYALPQTQHITGKLTLSWRGCCPVSREGRKARGVMAPLKALHPHATGLTMKQPHLHALGVPRDSRTKFCILTKFMEFSAGFPNSWRSPAHGAGNSTTHESICLSLAGSNLSQTGIE